MDYLPIIKPRIVAVIGIAAALCSCSQKSPPPTQTDAAASLARLLENSPNLALVDVGKPKNCEIGTKGSKAVDICRVCIVSVSAEKASFGGYKSFQLAREEYTATFNRAIDYGQPEVSVTDASKGVWTIGSISDVTLVNSLWKESYRSYDFPETGVGVRESYDGNIRIVIDGGGSYNFISAKPRLESENGRKGLISIAGNCGDAASNG